MTPGEIERTKSEADTAWESLRKAQGVVQRLIDEPAMPRGYREADLIEARHHLGAGLKAVNATRHRLELAALWPPLRPEVEDRVRWIVDTRISPVTEGGHLHESHTIYPGMGGDER